MRAGRHRRNGSRWIKVAVVCLAAVATAYGYASGPPAARTGAPGEQTCTQCHNGTLNSGAGSVAILGVPDVYTPGETYTLTVRVSHPDRRRWGFQITALDSASHGVGTFGLVNRNITRLVNGTGQQAGRVYIEHTTNGTFQGQTQNAEWEMKWTAPATDVGRVPRGPRGERAVVRGQARSAHQGDGRLLGRAPALP